MSHSRLCRPKNMLLVYTPSHPPNENTITHSLAVIGRILVPSHLSSFSLVVPTGVDKIIEVMVTTSTTEGGGNATSKTYIHTEGSHTYC